MKHGWRAAGLLILGVGLLSQFTNCDVYNENSSFGSGPGPSCVGVNCVPQSASMLALETVAEQFVISTEMTINVAGNCNEGGFPINTVYWTVLKAGAVRAACPANGACGVCVAGRFQIRIDLPEAPTFDTQVVLEIRGRDLAGTEFSNVVHGSRPIRLVVP